MHIRRCRKTPFPAVTLGGVNRSKMSNFVPKFATCLFSRSMVGSCLMKSYGGPWRPKIGVFPISRLTVILRPPPGVDSFQKWTWVSKFVPKLAMASPFLAIFYILESCKETLLWRPKIGKMMVLTTCDGFDRFSKFLLPFLLYALPWTSVPFF